MSTGITMRPRAIVAIQVFGAPGAYTSRRLKRRTYLGDPLNLVRQFQSYGVDEIVIVDVEAARDPASRRMGFLERLAGAASRPLSYVGGVRTARESEAIVELGFERIGFGSALFLDAEEVARAAASIGSQGVFAFLDHVDVGQGERVWTARAGLSSSTPGEAAAQAAAAGVGEIVLRSIQRDGLTEGIDRALAEDVATTCAVPLVVGGGLSVKDLDALDSMPWSVMGGTVFSVFRSAVAPMPHYLVKR